MDNKIDTNLIKEELTKIATQLLSGGEIEYSDVEVKIKVPTIMTKIVENIAEQSNETIEEVYSKMASLNLKNAIEQFTKTEDTAPESIFGGKIPEPNQDISAAFEKMTGLKDIMSQFNELSDKVKSMTKNLDIKESKK
jgi:methyl coenzyme M reductase subunit D